MSLQERRDLIRFLMDLGKSGHAATSLAHLAPHAPATFPFDRKPLQPELWPHWQEPVNRERVYDFYAKEAEYFRSQSSVPMLLPQFPGLDGGSHGHWGNQSEETWADARWNQADLGTVLCGVFRGNGLTVPKGVCVRLGEHGEMSAVFNPETLSYEALWLGGFVRFSAVRHGFLDGLIMNGIPLPRPAGAKPEKPFVVSRLLPAWQARGVRVSHWRRGIPRCAVGRRRTNSSEWSPRREATPWPAWPREVRRSGLRCSQRAASWASNVPMPSTRSSRPFRIPGRPRSSSAIMTSCPTVRRCSAPCRETSGGWMVWTSRCTRCAGVDSPRGCTRRSALWSPVAWSTSWVATRSRACTTSTATVKPTSMSA